MKCQSLFSGRNKIKKGKIGLLNLPFDAKCKHFPVVDDGEQTTN